MHLLSLFTIVGVCLLLCSCVANLRSPGPVEVDPLPEFSETSSGLKYRVLRPSTGAQPTPTDRVTVDYVGTLEDGTEFDSSYQRSSPATFGLSQVVSGWTEGLQLVGEGGMIELVIPPDLGYGSRGAPPVIPPGATLNFKVELIKVN